MSLTYAVHPDAIFPSSRTALPAVSRRRPGFGVAVTSSLSSSSSCVEGKGVRRRKSGEFTASPPDRRRVDFREVVREEQIEKFIYRFRFFTLLGVSGSLVGSVLCFLKGCVIIASSFLIYFSHREKVVQMLLEAIDVYLVGTVMLVLGMGLYELFISNLDIGKTSLSRSNFLGLFVLQERPRWLEIKSVNELKTKLGHVIVMVLLVGLFENVKKVVITSPIDLLCFAASILFSSCGLYLLSKLKH